MQTPSDNGHGMYRVDFESLIKVLGENLYSNPKAVVRELIQNASDSCVRRKTLEAFKPSITVSVDRQKHQLIFEDNGAGMVRDEVIQYLASIGGGLTREERKRLMTSDQESAKMLIGQFGLGFLSAFVVAERVIVETCSLTRKDPVNWECEGNSEYQISRGKRSEPGTKIILFLKQAHYDLLEDETLTKAIVRYADFILFPIYLNKGRQPVNRMNAPWHLDATESEYAEYIQHRYGVSPLALEIINVERDDLQVQGVLFIVPRKVEFERRLGSADVFQKRMYVGEDLSMLPEWAGFLSAVLDCSTLDLVASRESAISERPSYKVLEDYLAQAVVSFLKRLAERERPTFLEVIHQHDWAVMAGALRSDFFFDQVKDLIPIPTDMGPLTMPKYLERVPARLGSIKTIYYVPGEQPLGRQQSSLFKAQGVPICQADIVAEEFLRKYAARTENVNLRQMVSGVVELMEFAEEAHWRALEARYQELGIVAKAVKFHPPEMPAMVVRQTDYDQEQLIKQIVDGSRAVLDFMGRIGRETSDAYGLCFNVDNPIIKKLVEYQGDQMILDTALRAVYSSALLAAGIELTPELSQSVAFSQMRIIELVLEQSERIESGQTVGPYAASSFEMPVFSTVASPTDPWQFLPDDWSGLVDDDDLDEGYAYANENRPVKKRSFLEGLIRRFIK